MAVPLVLIHAAAVGTGGVAADGAVGQRGRAVTLYTPPPSVVAELPLTVQLVSVVVPALYRPPPIVGVAAGDGQARDRRRDTRVDLEHPAQPAAADRHARRRARDRLRPAVLLSSSCGAASG